MKALTKHFFNKQPLRWKQLNGFSKTPGFALRSFWSAAQSLGVLILSPSGAAVTMIHLQRVLAGLGHAFRAWLPTVRSTIINNRIYAGLVLVCIVAPLSSCVHMLFDKNAEVVGWYYYSYFYLYLVLGPYFFCLCIITTAFLWIPPKTTRIKFSHKHVNIQLTRALSIPFGLIAGKIIWLVQVTSNDEFHHLPSLLSIAAGLAIGYGFIRLLDYLVWRQEHVMNALIDSLEGLYNLPDMDHKQRMEMAAPYWKELREFHSKY